MIKQKKRYIAFKLYQTDQLSSQSIQHTLNRALTQIYGEYVASQTHLKVIQYHKDKGIVILRTNPKTLQQTKTAIATITHIDNIPIIPKILLTSGTIKKIQSTFNLKPQ
jgi:RNase P/RNase MRP subunit POP5